MTIHTNFREKKEPYAKRNVHGEQSGLMAQTHTLNAASHCKNKNIDEAVQKPSANKQCSLKPLTVRGNNTQSAEGRWDSPAYPGWWRLCACAPAKRALNLALRSL